MRRARAVPAPPRPRDTRHACTPLRLRRGLHLQTASQRSAGAPGPPVERKPRIRPKTGAANSAGSRHQPPSSATAQTSSAPEAVLSTAIAVEACTCVTGGTTGLPRTGRRGWDAVGWARVGGRGRNAARCRRAVRHGSASDSSTQGAAGTANPAACWAPLPQEQPLECRVVGHFGSLHTGAHTCTRS